MKYYLHLIDGQPAFYSKRDGQIVFMEDSSHWTDPVPTQVLRRSLAQIKQDQRLTKKHRESWGFKDSVGKYGYAIVTAPRS